jgi:hypothetical protein
VDLPSFSAFSFKVALFNQVEARSSFWSSSASRAFFSALAFSGLFRFALASAILLEEATG